MNALNLPFNPFVFLFTSRQLPPSHRRKSSHTPKRRPEISTRLFLQTNPPLFKLAVNFGFMDLLRGHDSLGGDFGGGGTDIAAEI